MKKQIKRNSEFFPSFNEWLLEKYGVTSDDMTDDDYDYYYYLYEKYKDKGDATMKKYKSIQASRSFGDPYSNREYKFAERFADHVCDKMYDDFGYYTEAGIDTLTRGIDFYVYEGETAQGEPLITYTVSSEDLDFTENKMATEVSYVCNDIEDAIRRL